MGVVSIMGVVPQECKVFNHDSNHKTIEEWRRGLGPFFNIDHSNSRVACEQAPSEGGKKILRSKA